MKLHPRVLSLLLTLSVFQPVAVGAYWYYLHRFQSDMDFKRCSSVSELQTKSEGVLTLSGYIVLDFELIAIYPIQADYTGNRFERAVWLEVSDSVESL